MDKKVKIAISDFTPLIITKGKQYKGFEIDLWEAIAKDIKLDFEYEIHSFKEIIPLLVDRKVDVGLAGITITEDREKIIDFSHPTFDSGLRILLSRTRKNIDFTETMRAFVIHGFKHLIKPFIIFSFIAFIFANIIWFVEKGFGSINPSYLIGISQAAWVSFGTLMGLLTGGTGTLIYDINTWAARCVLIVEHLLSLSILGLFIGELAAFVTTRKIRLNIDGEKDLQGKTVATVSNSTSERVLKDLGAEVITTSKIEDSYKKLKNNDVDAVVFDAPVLTHYLLNEGSKWADISTDVFEKQSYGIALQQGSTLRKAINQAFLGLKESGEYDSLYNKWFGEDLVMGA